MFRHIYTFGRSTGHHQQYASFAAYWRFLRQTGYAATAVSSRHVAAARTALPGCGSSPSRSPWLFRRHQHARRHVPLRCRRHQYWFSRQLNRFGWRLPSSFTAFPIFTMPMPCHFHFHSTWRLSSIHAAAIPLLHAAFFFRLACMVQKGSVSANGTSHRLPSLAAPQGRVSSLHFHVLPELHHISFCICG